MSQSKRRCPIEVITNILVKICEQNPYFATLIAFVGALRLIIPPMLLAAKLIAKTTPTKADDEAIEELENSDFFTKLLAILEWLTSIKVGGK